MNDVALIAMQTTTPRSVARSIAQFRRPALAQRNAVLEPQRQIHLERFRRLEAQIRWNDHEHRRSARPIDWYRDELR